VGFWRDKKRLSRALDRAGVRYALRPEGMRVVVDLHPEPENFERAQRAFANSEWPALGDWLAASPRPPHVVTETVTMTASLGPATDAEREEEAALLEAMSAAPDDDAPRLVYADRLMARGDPLGEFIAMQCQRDRALAPRIEARLRHGWVGLAAEAAPFVFCRGRPTFHFVRGFVDHVYMSVDDFVAHGAGVFAYPPPTLEITDRLPDCVQLAGVPALARVRHLVLFPGWSAVLGPLAAGSFDRLVHLEFGRLYASAHDRSADDDALFANLHAPGLASIDVSCKTTATVRAIANNRTLPRLRRYKEFVGYGSDDDRSEAYAMLARGCALEELELRHSSPDGCDDGLVRFFASETPPALRVLSLARTGVTDRLLHEIARSPKARLLETVRLDEDAITLDGLRALVAALPALRELSAATPDPDVAAFVRSRQTSDG
jgi:uncharacterized protein (TIGR02996 family)